MDGLSHFWQQSDTVGRAVALLLLLMSILAWVVILWKGWVLRRATQDVARAVPAFWGAATLDDARVRVRAMDRELVLVPLLEAASTRPGAGTLETDGQLASQLTRRLRDALHRGLAHLQFGQVLLASIGSTAPFVGLFGTVWGIYHALTGIAVAIPAVLAYNIYGKWIAASEAELEGFAHDLHEMVTDSQQKGR